MESPIFFQVGFSFFIESNSEFKSEKPRYAIKCASTTKYIYVKEVIKTFTDLKLYQFNLITTLEGGGTVIDPSK